MKILKITITLVCFLIFTISAHAGTELNCSSKFSLDRFLDRFAESLENKENQKSYFAYLKRCLPNNKSLQQQIDDNVIKILNGIKSQKIPKELWDGYLGFCLTVLNYNAVAGNPSSQHNFAMIHNSKPNSVLYKLVKQNYKTFVYWSFKAATQGEPRAMFNVAIRMAQEKPVTGFKQDYEMAYIVFVILERINNSTNGALSYIMPIVGKIKNKISTGFSKSKIDDLVDQSKSFDLKLLNNASPFQSPTN